MTAAATLDTTRASPDLVALFERFFISKSSHDDAGESRAFSEKATAYGDVVMGWLVAGHDNLDAALKTAAAPMATVAPTRR